MEWCSIKYSYQEYSLTHGQNEYYKRIEKDIDLLRIDFNPWNVANLDPQIVFKFQIWGNHKSSLIVFKFGGQMHQVPAPNHSGKATKFTCWILTAMKYWIVKVQKRVQKHLWTFRPPNYNLINSSNMSNN